MNHCHRDFKPYETWFLEDIEGFDQRELKIGKCPKCGCDVISLKEKRIMDGKVFEKQASKKDALHIIGLNIDKVLYSSLDVVSKKKVKVSMPRTIRYGENKMVKVGNGYKVRQRAVDFHGNKELIKEVRI